MMSKRELLKSMTPNEKVFYFFLLNQSFWPITILDISISLNLGRQHVAKLLKSFSDKNLITIETVGRCKFIYKGGKLE